MRLAKKAGQQGFILEEDSESFRREMHLFTGTAPYSRKVSYDGKLIFLARGVSIGGERTDMLIPADFLTDPTNNYELRKWVEELTGDPALVQRWSKEAKDVGNVRLRFRRASKGAADQGRPPGKPRARRPDIIAFKKEFYRRLIAEEKNGAEPSGLEKRILNEMVREKQMKLQVKSLQKRLSRP